MLAESQYSPAAQSFAPFRLVYIERVGRQGRCGTCTELKARSVRIGNEVKHLLVTKLRLRFDREHRAGKVVEECLHLRVEVGQSVLESALPLRLIISCRQDSLRSRIYVQD